jgi:isopentenyl-diphosphate delta-isomerase
MVVLVRENNDVIGYMEKMEAHRLGLLHRAFSVVIYNDQGEMLIQKRSANKYHTPGLWSNACCSHPRADETVEAAAKRRLIEELGFNCTLEFIGNFIYRAEFSNGLIEHELDAMLKGVYNGTMQLNPHEVSEVRWCEVDALRHEMEETPEAFTPWFREILNRI